MDTAPIVTLNAAVLSVAVLPALAAALVGRFSSFGTTVAAALAIGIVQSQILLFQPDDKWSVTATVAGREVGPAPGEEVDLEAARPAIGAPSR